MGAKKIKISYSIFKIKYLSLLIFGHKITKMLKILKFLFIVTISFLLFNFIAQNNGTVKINWLNHEIKTSIVVFIITITAIFYIISQLLNIKKFFKKFRTNKNYSKKK